MKKIFHLPILLLIVCSSCSPFVKLQNFEYLSNSTSISSQQNKKKINQTILEAKYVFKNLLHDSIYVKQIVLSISDSIKFTNEDILLYNSDFQKLIQQTSTQSSFGILSNFIIPSYLNNKNQFEISSKITFCNSKRCKNFILKKSTLSFQN